MNLPKMTKILLLAVAALAPSLVSSGASAQIVAPIIQCPAGYAYSSGYGCIPVSPGYAAVYGPPVVAAPPPVYDTFGLSLDIGGGGHGHGRGHDHGHGHR